LVDLPCACPTTHGKLTNFFYFFSVFHVQKFPKTIYMTYISQYPSQASYISQHASSMSQYPSQASYIIIYITNPHRSPKFIDKCTQKSIIHRQCT
jgi:hypothetical protein